MQQGGFGGSGNAFGGSFGGFGGFSGFQPQSGGYGSFGGQGFGQGFGQSFGNFGGGYGGGFSPFLGGFGGFGGGFNPMFGGIGGLGFNPMMGPQFGMPMQGYGGQQQFQPQQQQFQPQQMGSFQAQDAELNSQMQNMPEYQAFENARKTWEGSEGFKGFQQKRQDLARQMQSQQQPMFGGIGGLGFNPMMGRNFGMPMQGFGGQQVNPYQQQFAPYKQRPQQPFASQKPQGQYQQFDPNQDYGVPMDMEYRGGPPTAQDIMFRRQREQDMRKFAGMAKQGGMGQQPNNPNPAVFDYMDFYSPEYEARIRSGTSPGDYGYGQPAA
jgi:hypothetical protein